MNSRKTPSPQFNPDTSANKQQKPEAEARNWKTVSGFIGQQTETECRKLLCDICGFTTTQHNNQHKTYRPPSTKHQPSPTTTNTTITTTTTHHCHQHPTHQPSTPSQHTTPTKPSRASPASRPPVLLVARPPGCVLLAAFWATSPASQSARVPARPAGSR